MSENLSQANYGISGQPVNATIGFMSNRVTASAPQMQIFNGYESTTFNPTFADPPPSYAETTNSVPIETQIAISANICEDEVRSALNDFVSENRCFGSNPANRMIIRDIITNNVFHYKLETFTEKRESQWVYEPYRGQPISSLGLGPPPTPYDVYVVPEVPFYKSQKTIKIPNTANIRVCHICTANGRIRCTHCFGYGGSNCQFCNGSGRRSLRTNDGHCDQHHDHHHHNRCLHCDGNGRLRCGECDGHGQVQCQTCEGCGQLKYYLQLTVYWDNHVEDYVTGEGSVLPEGLVKQVSGSTALDERSPRVYPLNNFPNRSINEISRCLLQKHSQAFPLERIIEQRQSVRVIPVASVTYTYKEKVGEFQVYGLEHKVHFPHYPSKYCCGCTIL